MRVAVRALRVAMGKIFDWRPSEAWKLRPVMKKFDLESSAS